MEPAMKNRRLIRLLITGSLGTTIFLINPNGSAQGPLNEKFRPAPDNVEHTSQETPSEIPGREPPPPPTESSLERIEKLEAEINELKRSKASKPTLLPLPLWLLSLIARSLSLISLLLSSILYLLPQKGGSSRKRRRFKSEQESNQTINNYQNTKYISENLDSLKSTGQTFNLGKSAENLMAALTLDQPTSIDAKLNTPNPFPTSTSTPAPAPAPVTPSTSKTGLVSALNNGDRQQLRDAASAELNITDESENAIATGRSQATQLEEVSGGGSYWLICLNNQYWLFPTQRTLKGYTTAQPAKGIFQFEKKALSQPHLIEPACLERTGITWTVTSLGRIGTP